MNEVTVIHLGRQSFTISVAAHKMLKAYVHDIEQNAGKEVAEEVELRMAELLSEHGISGEKVVLEKDIDYLKEQLGSPTDFAEDEDGKTSKKSAPDADAPKRLYRDTDNAMIAGVASGLAAYFNIDPIIVRLIFVAAVLTGGWGIAIYILLWLLVPEAKTSSERLKMRGKAVTVDALKETVARADIQGATKRATDAATNVITKIFTIASRIIMGIIGVALVVTAGCMIFAAIAGGVYILGHHGQVSGQNIFPIGASETLLLTTAVLTAVTVASVLSLIGGAMVSLRWRTPGWVLATLAGLFIVSAGTTVALGADAAPRIHDRYLALKHTQHIALPAFTDLEATGNGANYTFIPDTKYYAEVSYVAGPKETHVPFKVENGVLRLDLTAISKQKLCDFLCFYNSHDLRVAIHAPVLNTVTVDRDTGGFMVSEPFKQDAITVTADKESHIDISQVYPATTTVTEDGTRWIIQLQGIRGTAGTNDTVHTDEYQVFITRSDTLEIHTNRQCEMGENIFNIAHSPVLLKLNDQTINGVTALTHMQSPERMLTTNCIVLPSETQR
ncbi:MAG TPA: PspC domain-containing protein [Bacillota bacterium]|nr:PspC domain-containing protein [Bacillota bacterium]